MPTVQSKSIHEVRLDSADLQKLADGGSIEVQAGNSTLILKSEGGTVKTTQQTDAPEREEDVGLEDLEEMNDGGGGGGGGLDKNLADGEREGTKEKTFTNEEVEVGNSEENLSPMVQKNPNK